MTVEAPVEEVAHVEPLPAVQEMPEEAAGAIMLVLGLLFCDEAA